MWIVWSFSSGLPLGALAVLAWSAEPGPGAVVLGAVSCATLLALATALRGRRVAGAAAVGWAALPLLGAALLALAPDPRLAVALVATGVGVGFAFEGFGGPLRRGLVALGLSVAGVVLWNWAAAELAAGVATVPETRTVALFDLDARVATRALPRCTARPRSVTTLLDRGAHPRFGAEGRLWFDAEGPSGRRQLHRLDLEDSSVDCWTCGEPGHNVRPAPGARDRLVAFETDRHQSWRHPANSEIHVVAGDAAQPGRRSRRMTFDPGRDGFPVFGPDAPLLVWSHASGGAHVVRAGSIGGGHGALVLRSASTVYSAGARWAAPLAWSPDARSLVVARGNPLAPVELLRLDPATGEVHELAEAGGLGAAFNADGGQLVWASVAQPQAPGAWAPAALGFLLGPWTIATAERESRFGRSGVRMAETGAPESVELEHAELGWGTITGVTFDPTGTRVVVAQRRAGSGGAAERLIHLELACELGRAAAEAA